MNMNDDQHTLHLNLRNKSIYVLYMLDLAVTKMMLEKVLEMLNLPSPVFCVKEVVDGCFRGYVKTQMQLCSVRSHNTQTIILSGEEVFASDAEQTAARNSLLFPGRGDAN